MNKTWHSKVKSLKSLSYLFKFCAVYLFHITEWKLGCHVWSSSLECQSQPNRGKKCHNFLSEHLGPRISWYNHNSSNTFFSYIDVSVYYFVIHVIDTEDPVFTQFPGNIKHQLKGETYTSITWTEPTVTDNSEQVSLISYHNPDDLFAIGRTVVVYTAVDPSGNAVSKSFTVIVSGM